MKHLPKLTAAGALAVAALLVAATACVTSPAFADYPERDVTFVNPYAPGGSSDIIARQFAKQLERSLGAKVNVENKPGGSGTIGMSTVMRARPDGYTIGLGANSPLAYEPLVVKGLAYRSPDDYQSICKINDMPAILLVRADAPWKTFDEFMAEVRKNPGKIRCSNSGLGGTTNLVTQQLNQFAGVRIATIPFTGGSGEALLALLGGRVEANVSYGAGALGHVQAGKVRVLAVFKKGRYDLFPDVPSVDEAGYDATLSNANYAIAPNGLPRDVLGKLVKASLEAVRSEEFLKFLKANGLVPDAKGPEETRAELVQYGKIFADLVKFIGKK
jgi:tripartite-type tricarboxylate transporter receptor subunit TctC